MAATGTGSLDIQGRRVATRGARVPGRRVRPPLLLLALAGIAASCGAAIADEGRGDPAKGAARADALFCAGCHGPSGRSVMPDYPALAGQGEAYLAQQLRLFRAGEREGQEMGPVTASLTDADIADLSAYYAAQAPRTAGSAPPAEPPAVLDLYRSGDAARSIQPCAACHGPDGRGDAATATPALRSLQPAYVRTQLQAYAGRSRYRSAVPDGTQRAGLEAMYDVAARLTEDEARDLAQYLQSLP